MSFGTVHNDISFRNKYDKKAKNKKAKNEPVKMEIDNNEIKKETSVMYPQLPANWKKETYTGDVSYDTTVTEINQKLKRTMVFIFYPGKKHFINQGF